MTDLIDLMLFICLDQFAFEHSVKKWVKVDSGPTSPLNHLRINELCNVFSCSHP